MPILDSNNELYKPHAALILELCVVWGFTYVNILSIHIAGVVQFILTIIKVIPLLVISLLGLEKIHIVNLVQFTPNHMTYFSAISGAAALTFWAFIGLEAATIPAENTRGNKDIARATIYGTLLTSFIYIVSTFVLMGMIPLSQLQNSQFPFSIASTLLFGHMGAILVTGCAVISGLGALNVCVLLQGQIVFAAARDNVFPSMFAKLSKNDVPISGQLLSSGLVTLLLIFTIEPMLLNQFNYIALLAALLALITYLITSFSEIKFLYVEMNNKGQLILNKKFLIPILAVLYSLWMLISLEEKILFAGSIILVIFIPIYFLTVKRQG
ncbi:MAG: Amino acid permease family protein [uncultured bacterium]|nr:MAG: Amino acid permease family protein [uncultured bacterium]